MGDDGRSFCLCGSLYFDEVDWAAEADFYPAGPVLENIFQKMGDEIEELFEGEYQKYGDEIISLIYGVAAFTIYRLMQGIHSKPVLMNTGIGMGFSDDEEFLLGEFKKGRFQTDMRYLGDVDYRRPPSIVRPEPPVLPPRGPLYAYISWNYRDLLREEGLISELFESGEEWAENIVEKLGDKIFINKCKLCGHIKMTPRARQCLGCGEFSEEFPF